MILLAGLALPASASLAFIALQLRKAPEGFEDRYGFHSLERETRVKLPMSQVSREKSNARGELLGGALSASY